MTSSIQSFADHKAGRLTRQAILAELHRPRSDPGAPAAAKLQQVARGLVQTCGHAKIDANDPERTWPLLPKQPLLGGVD